MVSGSRHSQHAADGQRIRRRQAVGFDQVAYRHVVAARNAVEGVAFADGNIIRV